MPGKVVISIVVASFPCPPLSLRGGFLSTPKQPFLAVMPGTTNSLPKEWVP